MQEKQYNLQNQLLEDLANSSGNILENKVVAIQLQPVHDFYLTLFFSIVVIGILKRN